MSKLLIKDELNEKFSLELLQEKSSFLNIFLYLAQAQPGKIEYICHFLQKYQIKLGFLTKKKRFFFKNYLHVNANFVAQSAQLISEKDFATINHFLSSQVIIVSISYQNQIWTLSRFLKWHKVFLKFLSYHMKFMIRTWELILFNQIIISFVNCDFFSSKCFSNPWFLFNLENAFVFMFMLIQNSNYICQQH